MEFQIPSDVGAIAPVVDKIVDGIRESRCLPGRESDIAVALFEALANAVIHGNREDQSKQVRIVCRRQPLDCLSIIVSDEGTGFDPAAVPDPTLPENIGAEHGRGILMMRAYMDEVRFENGGTEVHMIKKCEAVP